jgi:hypothetical protein
MWPYLLLGLLIAHLAAPLTIAAGVVIGLISRGWLWVLALGAIVGFIAKVALHPFAAAVGLPVPESSDTSPDLMALGTIASLIAHLIWSGVFFWIKQSARRVYRVLGPQS